MASTDKLFAGMTAQKGWVAAVRNTLIPIFAATLSRSGTMRARAFHFVSQLGIRYHESEFVHEASSAGAPKAWREGLSAGRRAPNALFARNRDVFDLIGGYRFAVLALSRQLLTREQIAALATDLDHLRRSCGILIDTHVIAHSLVGRDPRILQAESTQVFDAYGLTSETPQALFLIRPDGYIAYRSDRLDVERLGEFVRTRFGGAP